MDLQKEILKEHSKAQRDHIVSFVGNDELRFGDIMNLFLTGDYRVSQRASWVVSVCVEKNPFLIYPYLESVINNLNNPVHDAVKRNTVRILQFIEIPESLYGITAEVCFGLLANKKEAVAIRVFSMTALLQIVKKLPELKIELQILIEDQMHYSSAAFVSRGTKTLKALKGI